MKKIISILILTSMVLLSSCMEEEGHSIIPEGKPATLILKIEEPAEMEVATKGLTTYKEQTLTNLFILIFNSSGSLLTSENFTKVYPPGNVFMLETYSGTGNRIVVIANYTPDVEDDLRNIYTLDDLNDITYMEDETGSTLSQPPALPMIGKLESQDIAAGTSNISVPLEYACAKVTVEIKDDTSLQDVNMIGWDVGNFPASGWLMPHTTDAVTTYKTTDSTSLFERVTIGSGKVSWTQTIYMMENRKGGRTSRSTEGLTSDQITKYAGEKGKSFFAPEGASHFIIYFNYYNRTGEGYSYENKYTLYLGENIIDDYNLQRGYHYKYTITIKENYNVKVDLDVNSNITSKSPKPLAIATSSSMRMDAHFSQRAVALIPKAGHTFNNVSVEILDEEMRHFGDVGFNAEWLKISPIDISLPQVKQATQLPFQPAGVTTNYFVRNMFVPHKSDRAALQSIGHAYTPPSGITLSASGTGNGIIDSDSNGIPDDLPDDDDVLPFAQATYRMCYKITDIPISGEMALYFYANEYEYDTSKPEIRRANIQIKFTDTSSGNQEYSYEIPISQIQPYMVGGVVDHYNSRDNTTSYKEMVVEVTEENKMVTNPIISLSSQSTDIMQWGASSEGINFFSRAGNSNNYNEAYRDGYYLTANAVYDDVSKNASTGETSFSGSLSKLRPLYGSGRYKGTGRITQPTTLYASDNSGSPYYSPNIKNAARTSIDAPQYIFNMDAPHYCHEKNKDQNGDGILEPWEVKWYLPSLHELMQVFASLEAIKSSFTEFGVGSYHSSSEWFGATNKVYQLGFATGFMDTDGYAKNSMDNTNLRNGAVRCVRKTDIVPNDPTFMLENDIPYIDCCDMPELAVTSTSKGSGTGQMEYDLTTTPFKETLSYNAATVYEKFRVAKADATIDAVAWNEAVGYPSTYNSTLSNGTSPTDSTGCNSYHETGDNGRKWRLPNKKELALIWIYKTQLSRVNKFTAFKDGDYWSASERTKDQGHYLNFPTGNMNNSSKKIVHRVRCILEDDRINNYTLTYHAEGCTNLPDPVSITFAAQNPVTISTTTPMHPSGKTFIGWFYSPSGDPEERSIMVPGHSYIFPPTNIDLYAFWEE